MVDSNELNTQEIEQRSKTLNMILRDEHEWQSRDFVDGMAPLDINSIGLIQWRPRSRLSERNVFLTTILTEGTLLKFMVPSKFVWNGFLRTMDFYVWRGYFNREAVWSGYHPKSKSEKSIFFNRWVEFEGFHPIRGVSYFRVRFLDSDIAVSIPTIVMNEAERIKITFPN